MPAPDAVTVTAPTLEEAYRRVRAGFGGDAVILATRSVMRPDRRGLHLERQVELTVARGDGRRDPVVGDPDLQRITDRLADGVERLEARVAELRGERGTPDARAGGDADDAVDGLVRSGASRPVAERLVRRFAVEKTGDDFSAWLTGRIPSADCGWDAVEGRHAVVGTSGSGRTRLVLGAAARTAAAGSRTLVLSVAPTHPGEIRRLQAAAAEHEFDAAVIRRPEQIVELAGHVSDYRTVFVDLPALDDPAMVRGGELHSWLAGHHGIHRHLLVPLDLDPADWDHLPRDGRALNCDRVALGRLDRTRRPGKLLDLLEAVPLPVSFLAGTAPARIADPVALGELLGPLTDAAPRGLAGEQVS